MSSSAVPLHESAAAARPYKKWMTWAGWAISLWPAFVIISSANWKLTRNAWYVGEFDRIGWPDSALPLLAGLQLAGLLLFLIPRTAALGAIILTGYLGGAIATYVRINEFYPPLVPGSTAVIAWLGLFLRDDRVRAALLPFRR